VATALGVLAVTTCRSRGVPPSTPEEDKTTVEEKIEPAAGTWGIRAGAVGSLEIGRPLPNSLLGGDLETFYAATLIADGIPWEGFRFDKPPLWVGIRGGPFAKEASHDPDTERLKPLAAAAARAGAKIVDLRVHAPGPATAAGVGVGSTLPALRRAYPDLSLQPTPPTFGKDECVATTPTLEGVYFLFSSCGAAESGAPVERIDLWSEEQELDDE
jgi:hypothetical protein